jgi:hypothetical protein
MQLTCSRSAEQLELATADSRAFFHYVHTHKEIDMTTSKPIELGRVSEETKETSPGPSDNGTGPFGPPTA